MEILAEIFFGLLQFLGELLIQMLFEIAAELGFHSVKETFAKQPNPVFASIGYIIFGAAAGWLSLLAFPTLVIASPLLRLLNLVFTPMASGAIMAAIGALRVRREQSLVRLDRFGYSVLFAFSMALVRFIWAGHA